jgi:hypothetical protein
MVTRDKGARRVHTAKTSELRQSQRFAPTGTVLESILFWFIRRGPRYFDRTVLAKLWTDIQDVVHGIKLIEAVTSLATVVAIHVFSRRG